MKPLRLFSNCSDVCKNYQVKEGRTMFSCDKCIFQEQIQTNQTFLPCIHFHTIKTCLADSGTTPPKWWEEKQSKTIIKWLLQHLCAALWEHAVSGRLWSNRQPNKRITAFPPEPQHPINLSIYPSIYPSIYLSILHIYTWVITFSL